jgi:hypothetical protein
MPATAQGDHQCELGQGFLRPVLLAEAPVEAPVDAFAEQVGVPVVAGVLPDHVHEQLAQRDRLTLEVAATKPRSWSRVNCSAKATSSRYAAIASPATARGREP